MILAEVDTILRAIRGAPATVLLLMLMHPEPVSQAYIVRRTGYTDHTVSKAVEVLANDFAMITQVGRYTWQLAGQNRQLPLSAAELVTEAVSVESLPVPAQAVEKPVEKKLGRKICDLSSQILRPIPSSSSRFNDSKDIENLPPLDSDSSQKMRANFEALHQAGVRQPALNRLAKLAHVTPELVAGHAQTAPNVRLAIYRIENNWPVPRQELSAEDERRKFVEGEYAEFIHR